MLKWLKSLFEPPQPAGPSTELASFSTSDPTIAQDVIKPQSDGSWKIYCPAEQTVRLFDIPDPGVNNCMLTYRADLKTENVKKRCYLEMWCRFQGNEYFSKGVQDAIKGTNDWSSYEIPFYLKRGQTPDLLKLNLVLEGSGTVWIRNIQIVQTPLE